MKHDTREALHIAKPILGVFKIVTVRDELFAEDGNTVKTIFCDICPFTEVPKLSVFIESLLRF